MPLINRLLVAFLVWEVLVLVALPSRAQPAPEAISVPMTAIERGAVLALCDDAVWASKRRFDGTCDYFKVKFEAAERDAKAKADADKAALPAPAEQPKE